jgi:type IV pilus assembly protein PilB
MKEGQEGTIKELLIKENYVAENDMKAAIDYAKKHKTSIVEYLMNNNLITKDLLGQAMAESFGVPYADLNSTPLEKQQVLRIPEDIERKYHVVLFSDKDKTITVCTDNPTQKNLSSVIKKIFKKAKITVAFSLTEDVETTLHFYQKSLETRFAKIIKSQNNSAPSIIDEIIKDALATNTSDIHFEPQHEEVLVRFRIDGVLQEAGRIQKSHYSAILNRVKIQAQLRIDEHFAAQDGSIRYDIEKQRVDIRVSILPTIDGEKIAMRVLADTNRLLSLDDLGLSPAHQKLLTVAADKPFGMILVVGPTGSGKTTTLYALLRHVNSPGENITTIEDPVEYRMTGINQIQVNVQTNLTFAQGLKSIVRQDPDTILVGEIRDHETAEIAVNAALTGHLLLSTFHANDAATAMPRLLDMGIEPYLLASSLELIIAQRLVRKICETCRTSENSSLSVIEKKYPLIKNQVPGKTMTLYHGKGCAACHNTGYRGRVGLFEMISLSETMKSLLLRNPSTQQITDVAEAEGTDSMFKDGMIKVKNGITTLDEVLRVAPPSYVKKNLHARQ